MVNLRGIFPIVYTPFNADGQIDEEDLFHLVDYLIDSGAHGLAAVGGASECHKLSLVERKWLAERTIAAARRRVPVMVGVSAANTVDAIELARHAAELGACAVFAAPPLFGPASTKALVAYYSTLARAVSLPIFIQDAQVSVGPALVAQLADVAPNLRYLKEESPSESGHRISEVLELTRGSVTVFSGGAHLLDDLARGAVGAIPGSIGVADLVAAYERYQQGDYAGARAAFDHFLPLSFWRRQFPLMGAKEVLRRLRIINGAYLREPADQYLDEADHRELSAIMEKMGPPY